MSKKMFDRVKLNGAPIPLLFINTPLYLYTSKCLMSFNDDFFTWCMASDVIIINDGKGEV